MELLSQNPLLAACGIFCFWPAVTFGVGFVLGRMVGRRGIPRLTWGG